MTRPPRILFVAMQNSIHAARWITQLDDFGWDLHLFPVDHGVPHASLRNLTVHRPFHQLGPHGPFRAAFATRHTLAGTHEETDAARPHLRFAPILPIAAPALAERIAARLPPEEGPAGVAFPRLYGPRMLARAIAQVKPDLVHSLEFQHCGYRVLAARTLLGEAAFPPWLATNWGSDVVHYARDPAHRAVIQRLLAAADFYSCECVRDVSLAREQGFAGEVLPVMPNSGGFDLAALQPLRDATPPSRRDVILVKGYEHFAGRALTALAALEQVADVLADKHLVMFSAVPEVAARARDFAQRYAVALTILPTHTPHDEMLTWHARARLYLGVSIADAISTSLLEAIVMGAFPIQTDTSCCSEWIADGESGFAVPLDVASIAQRLRVALTDDALVDAAAARNWRTATARLDRQDLISQARSFYDAALRDPGKRSQI